MKNIFILIILILVGKQTSCESFLSVVTEVKRGCETTECTEKYDLDVKTRIQNILSKKDIEDYEWAVYYFKYHASVDGNKVTFSDAAKAKLCKKVFERLYKVGISFHSYDNSLHFCKPFHEIMKL